MGVKTDASRLLAMVVEWFVKLIVLVVAFDALGLPAVSDVLRQLLLWLPNLVVGLVVLVIGGLLANAASSLVRGATAEAGFDNPDCLAKIASVAVWAFAIVIAVNEIGIAATLVNTLFKLLWVPSLSPWPSAWAVGKRPPRSSRTGTRKPNRPLRRSRRPPSLLRPRSRPYRRPQAAAIRRPGAALEPAFLSRPGPGSLMYPREVRRCPRSPTCKSSMSMS